MTDKEVEKDLEEIAEQSGLALVLVDETSEISASNNNSICEVLNSSTEFAPRCALFCGQAFVEATTAGKVISRQCYAGLHYQALPIKTGENKQLVAITGRTFLHSDDYRKATERNISGDWQKFSATDLFENMLLSSSEQEIEKLTRCLEKLSDEQREAIGQLVKEEAIVVVEKTTPIVEDLPPVSPNEEISKLIEQFHQNKIQLAIEQSPEKNAQELEDLAAWRSLFSSLLSLNYREACISVAQFIAQRYKLTDLAWLENKKSILEAVWASGNFVGQQIQIGIPAEDSRFKDALQKETSLELRERKRDDQAIEKLQKINLFPLAVGGKVRSALAVGDDLLDSETNRHIARFVRQVASELEILRLREEINRHSTTTQAVNRLNQMLRKIDSEEFWMILAQFISELMQAERGSLLIYNEENKEFIVKAAIGSSADVINREMPVKIGERIAHNVLRSGRPLVVKHLKTSGVVPAPNDWKYKTDSFISYPIVVGGRKIGVLNVTDKVDGSSYDETDLDILHTLAPQFAVAIDHTALISKVDKFEQLSMTDALTGLLNRRYLEARLNEEIMRSQRHGYPMCFMMIDVDEFKSYNDAFSHPEGDKALQMVGQCLKSTLRGADVAARYGGEEFSILLPQTTLREATTIAKRLREKVAKTRFPNRQVTISIGLANCNAEFCDAGELISAADKALYGAKTKGRNRVEIYQRDDF
ncbi:MAG TPA: diguanylate cyclase [Pyrinomonadaceae bacterium]|nr:diguanylate cyclase [Pyrinomonadaceae bacterium]